MTTLDVIDAHLPPAIRVHLEETLWRPIEEQATLEAMSADPGFFDNPGGHPAMFADHGIVHVRDVAAGLVRLVDEIDGVLLSPRPERRRRLVQTWGVALAYLHDIGMVDMTPEGRRTHPLYAAHVAFSSAVDPLVEHLLGPGQVRASLDEVQGADGGQSFGLPLDIVVREVLALSAAHSKTTVPQPVLADRAELARLMRYIVLTSMADHRATTERTRDVAAQRVPVGNGVAHPAPAAAFGWLTADEGPLAELVDDLVDAVRALRAADVLRQRGTALRTSGGFEVYFDARTGRAVCTLRPADDRAAYVVDYDSIRGAGEANVRSASLTPRGDLRIAFHRGAFVDGDGASRAAVSVADAIADIWLDAGPAFEAAGARGLPAPAKSAADMRVELERPGDDPTFADRVREELASTHPGFADRVHVVAGVEEAAPAERDRYHRGASVDPHGPLADEVVARLVEHGADLTGLDRDVAFGEVRLARVAAGEVVVDEGSAPVLVYVPLGEGLTVRPGGGYARAPLHPWVPVGTTGAVRGAPRNAGIVTDRTVDVLLVPSALYVASWLRPLSPEGLRARLGQAVGR